MVLKTAKCLGSAWRRIKCPFTVFGRHLVIAVNILFLNWLGGFYPRFKIKLSPPLIYCQSNLDSINKDQEYDDAWNVFLTDVLFLPMLMRSWTWVMLAGSTSSNNWPSKSDWPTHTLLAMHFYEKRFSLLSPRLTNTWSIHGGRTFQQPSCCPSDHTFRMTTTALKLEGQQTIIELTNWPLTNTGSIFSGMLQLRLPGQLWSQTDDEPLIFGVHYNYNSLSKIRQVGTSDPIVAFSLSNGFLQDILVPLSQCHKHLELFRESHRETL